MKFSDYINKITAAKTGLFLVAVALSSMAGWEPVNSGILPGSSVLAFAASDSNLLRHPTQLYEMVSLVLLTLVLLRYKPFLAEGRLFWVFLIAYLTFHFLSEFIKPVPVLLWYLSGIQWTCLIGLCCNWRLLTFFSSTHKPKGADAS